MHSGSDRNRGGLFRGIVCHPKARLPILAIAGSILLMMVLWVLPALFTDTSRWKRVEGRVLESRLRIRHGKGELRIRYAYEVNGQTYESRKAALWTDSIPRASLPRGQQTELEPGTPIQVYHHPDKPGLAVLDPYISPLHKVAVVFGTAICALGVFGALVGRAPE